MHEISALEEHGNTYKSYAHHTRMPRNQAKTVTSIGTCTYRNICTASPYLLTPELNKEMFPFESNLCDFRPAESIDFNPIVIYSNARG